MKKKNFFLFLHQNDIVAKTNEMWTIYIEYFQSHRLPFGNEPAS